MAVSLAKLLADSTRNLNGVNPAVKELALEVVRRAYAKGINVQITSGLRSMTEQAKLYGQGRTSYIYNGVQYARAGNIVTNAKPGQSIHNYGLAVDFALVTDAGAIHWDINRDLNANQVRDWFEVGAIGKSLGFAWGGDWTSFKDYPHLDFQKGISLANLAAGKRPVIPTLTQKDWFEMGDSGKDITALQNDFNKAGRKVGVDGIFGKEMDAAVRDLQKDHKLTVDGQFGAASRNALNDEIKAKDAAAAKAKADAKKKADAAAKAKADAAAKKKADDAAKAKAEAEKIKGGEIVEGLIVLHGKDDFVSAYKLHVKTGFPMLMKEAAKTQKAKEIIVIGGKADGFDKKAEKFTLLSGNTWDETVAKVAAYVKTLK